MKMIFKLVFFPQVNFNRAVFKSTRVQAILSYLLHFMATAHKHVVSQRPFDLFLAFHETTSGVYKHFDKRTVRTVKVIG